MLLILVVEIMKIKDELLISNSAYKIAFIPPGSSLAKETMLPIHASGQDSSSRVQEIKETSGQDVFLVSIAPVHKDRKVTHDFPLIIGWR
jgi:hypothetical protein